MSLSEMKTVDAELCRTALFYSAGPPVSLLNPLSQAPLRALRLQGRPCHSPGCFEVQILWRRAGLDGRGGDTCAPWLGQQHQAPSSLTPAPLGHARTHASAGTAGMRSDTRLCPSSAGWRSTPIGTGTGTVGGQQALPCLLTPSLTAPRSLTGSKEKIHSLPSSCFAC